MPALNENIYLQRINLVIDHIHQNITRSDALTLEALAQVAGFSPFHFHRIFKTLTDETVNDFVTRVRVERAATLLRAAPHASIGAVATACGFNSAAVFSRAFKRHFGLTAREWNRDVPLKNSKNGQILAGFPRYTVDALAEMENTDSFVVHRRDIRAQQVAYIRVVNSYQPERVTRAYDRLLVWYATQVGGVGHLIGMSQDDPEVTPLRLCRYDVCLILPDHWRGSAAGEVHLRTLPACTLAMIRCVGDIWQVDRAWQYLYRWWLPRSRYVPANLPAMEIYRQQPAELGWEHYDMECAIPVMRL